MSLFYVYGFTQQEARSRGMVSMDAAHQAEVNPEYRQAESGNVVVYSLDTQEIHRFFPEYQEFTVVQIIKESFLPFTHLNKHPLRTIPENELPNGMGVLVQI